MTLWACRQVTHFVRRRRWVRTQRPSLTDGSQSPGSQAAGGSLGGSPPREGQLLEALSFPKPMVRVQAAVLWQIKETLRGFL